MATKFFVDALGNYIGGFAGADPPVGAIEVSEPPLDARQIWDGTIWGPIPRTRLDDLHDKLAANTISAGEIREMLRLRGF